MRARPLVLMALLSLGLAGCNRPTEGAPTAPGTTGSGAPDAGGRSQTAQPGARLSGGMSGSSGLGMTGTFPSGTTTTQSAGAAAAGSPDRTPRSGVGTR
jgi:hypothetical protein